MQAPEAILNEHFLTKTAIFFKETQLLFEVVFLSFP